MRHPQFTHDGHYLVLWADGLNQVQIYDTGTWQKVPGLPEVPAGAERYTLSSNGERAIVQSAKSSVELWDVGKHEKIAALGENAHESAVSFSPDGSMVAMVQINGPDKDIRLKVWSTQTGNVLQKFSSYEVPNLGAVSAIGWSNDGEYLFIAPNSDRSSVSFNIRVLNVKTGLHLGDFADSEGTVGIVYLPKIGQLIAGGGDGRVRFWDFNSALQQIKAFKASLEN
jgi:WD40 repeat protein